MNFTNEAARISVELNLPQQMCHMALVYAAQTLLLETLTRQKVLTERNADVIAAYSDMLLEAGVSHLPKATDEQQDRLAVLCDATLMQNIVKHRREVLAERHSNDS